MTTDRARYPGVPEDFPVSAITSAIGGAHPKMSLVEEDGKFYAPGTAPSEVTAAFHMCDDLVSQMVPYCSAKVGDLRRGPASNREGCIKRSCGQAMVL